MSLSKFLRPECFNQWSYKLQYTKIGIDVINDNLALPYLAEPIGDHITQLVEPGWTADVQPVHFHGLNLHVVDLVHHFSQVRQHHPDRVQVFQVARNRLYDVGFGPWVFTQ